MRTCINQSLQIVCNHLSICGDGHPSRQRTVHLRAPGCTSWQSRRMLGSWETRARLALYICWGYCSCLGAMLSLFCHRRRTVLCLEEWARLSLRHVILTVCLSWLSSTPKKLIRALYLALQFTPWALQQTRRMAEACPLNVQSKLKPGRHSNTQDLPNFTDAH